MAEHPLSAHIGRRVENGVLEPLREFGLIDDD